MLHCQVAKDSGQVAATKVTDAYKKLSSKAMENERVKFVLEVLVVSEMRAAAFKFDAQALHIDCGSYRLRIISQVSLLSCPLLSINS